MSTSSEQKCRFAVEVSAIAKRARDAVSVADWHHLRYLLVLARILFCAGLATAWMPLNVDFGSHGGRAAVSYPVTKRL